MAVTQGHGNPDWTRDETILALDLYLKCGGQIPGPTDPRVIQLSEQLRSLPVHTGTAKRTSFRNPAGVAFKVQNLRQVATGKGLKNCSAVDRSVWQDFGERTSSEVSNLAARILAGTSVAGVTQAEVLAVDPDEEFVEGRVLTAVHRVRERSAKLRNKLIVTRMAKGPLSCDACGDGPKTAEKHLIGSGFEVHHTHPLSNGGPRATRLSDLALLCATCHRMIHRAMHVQRRWMSVPQFSELLTRNV